MGRLRARYSSFHLDHGLQTTGSLVLKLFWSVSLACAVVASTTACKHIVPASSVKEADTRSDLLKFIQDNPETQIRAFYSGEGQAQAVFLKYGEPDANAAAVQALQKLTDLPMAKLAADPIKILTDLGIAQHIDRLMVVLTPKIDLRNDKQGIFSKLVQNTIDATLSQKIKQIEGGGKVDADFLRKALVAYAFACCRNTQYGLDAVLRASSFFKIYDSQAPYTLSSGDASSITDMLTLFDIYRQTHLTGYASEDVQAAKRLAILMENKERVSMLLNPDLPAEARAGVAEDLRTSLNRDIYRLDDWVKPSRFEKVSLKIATFDANVQVTKLEEYVLNVNKDTSNDREGDIDFRGYLAKTIPKNALITSQAARFFQTSLDFMKSPVNSLACFSSQPDINLAAPENDQELIQRFLEQLKAVSLGSDAVKPLEDFLTETSIRLAGLSTKPVPTAVDVVPADAAFDSGGDPADAARAAAAAAGDAAGDAGGADAQGDAPDAANDRGPAPASSDGSDAARRGAR